MLVALLVGVPNSTHYNLVRFSRGSEDGPEGSPLDCDFRLGDSNSHFGIRFLAVLQHAFHWLC